MKLPLVLEDLILSFCFYKCSYCKAYFEKDGICYYYNKYTICYECLEEMWNSSSNLIK